MSTPKKKPTTEKKPSAKVTDAIAPFAGFPKTTFTFLGGIAEHHDEAWFDEHRAALFLDGTSTPATSTARARSTLDRYRQAVLDAKAGEALEGIVSEIESRGDLKVRGATRTKVPRGFDPDHPRAKLLLHEGLFAHYEGAVPKEAKTADFAQWCAERYARCVPIVKWLRTHVVDRRRRRSRLTPTTGSPPVSSTPRAFRGLPGCRALRSSPRSC